MGEPHLLNPSMNVTVDKQTNQIPCDCLRLWHNYTKMSL